MAQTLVPFSHENTSELAKSLRKSLAESGHPGIKQTQMLGALAKSTGARNFQAYRQKPTLTRDSNHLVALSTVIPSIGELIGRDDRGDLEDRRHQPVQRLIYGLNTRMDLGAFIADVVLRVEARGQFDSDYEPDEALIEDKALEALADAIVNESVDLHQRIDLTIDLESRTAESLRGNGSKTRIAHVPDSALCRLWESAAQVNASTHECEDCVAFLDEIASDPSKAVQEKPKVRRALDYLQGIVDCSGQPFMYNWNSEKVSGIYDIVGRWSDGDTVDEMERRYVFENLLSFRSPSAWVRRPKLRWRFESKAA